MTNTNKIYSVKKPYLFLNQRVGVFPNLESGKSVHVKKIVPNGKYTLHDYYAQYNALSIMGNSVDDKE